MHTAPGRIGGLRLGRRRISWMRVPYLAPPISGGRVPSLGGALMRPAYQNAESAPAALVGSGGAVGALAIR